VTGDWIVRVAETAEADFREIIRWTHERFGENQARAYGDTITEALSALSAGPSLAGVRARDDIAPGILLLHIARGGRKGRHFLMFRAARHGSEDIVEVLRILHDSMALARHLSQAR
jgi:toxin ParE1/3/4